MAIQGQQRRPSALGTFLFRNGFAIATLLFLTGIPVLWAANANVTTGSTMLSGSIPFDLYQGYVVVVRGTIGTRTGLNFMVDTGARPSVVDAALARELGINGNPSEMRLPNAQVAIQFAELAELNIGPLHKTKQKIIISDLSNLRSQLGIPIHGMIGLDVLGESSFTIDYQHHQINFGAVDNVSSIPFEASGSVVILKLEKKGEPLRVVLDTGTPGLLLFRRQAGQLPGVKFLGSQDMRSIGGWMRVDRVTIDGFSLGDRELGVTPATIADDQSGWSAKFDGVIGPASLHLKRLSFDFEHHRIGWTP